MEWKVNPTGERPTVRVYGYELPTLHLTTMPRSSCRENHFYYMPESPTLLNQLATRTKAFLSQNNLTQKEVCRLLKLDRGNFSKFLNGQVGLGAETTLALVRLMNLSKRDLELKFAAPDRTRAPIVNLQERGKVMRLDSAGHGCRGLAGKTPMVAVT
jgi:predicted XRE-type DNA-binding protein